MPNANVITQLEYRLNNLSGSETNAELLALRATVDKYPTIDSAAVALLDAAITDDANTLTNSSSIKELATVGQAAYEPVVESPTVFSEVNDQKAINSGEDTVIQSDGTEWLRSGIIDDDLAAYPDATVHLHSLKSPNLLPLDDSINSSIDDMTFDNEGNYWLVIRDADQVMQLDKDGNQTGLNFYTSSQETNPLCAVVGKGTDTIWVAGSINDRVYGYNVRSGEYLNVDYSLGLTNPSGLTQDDAYDFWGISDSNIVRRYSSVWVYQDTFTASEVVQAEGITFDGTHLWVLCGNTNKCYQYTKAGVHTGNTIDVNGVHTSYTTCCYNDGGIWLGNGYLYSLEKRELDGGFYNNVHFLPSITPSTQTGRGCTFDDANWWIVDPTNDELIKLNPDGSSALTVDLTTLVGSTNAECVHYFNGFIWVGDSATDKIYKINTDGTDTGVVIDLLQDVNGSTLENYIRDITDDGTYLYIIGTIRASVSQLDSEGIPTGVVYDVSDITNAPRGLAFDGEYFWVLDNLSIVHQLTSKFVPTGFTASLKMVNNGGYQLAYKDGSIYTNMYQLATIAEFIKLDVVGLGNAILDNGSPVYTRIK